MKFEKGNSYSANRKGVKLSDEHKRKIGLANANALKGRKLSEETKTKIKANNALNKGGIE